MNPAVTLAFWQMERISTSNAIWYVVAQFIGGALGVYLFKWTVPAFISEQGVQYAVTVPGMDGAGGAFASEWVYFLAPISGMMLAGFLYRKWYRQAHGGNCLSMKCHFSGNRHNCTTYEVLGPSDLLNDPAQTLQKN